MKRVLVTGGHGFIGRNVLVPLAERGFDVHAVSRTERHDGSATWHTADLLDRVAIRRLVDDVRPSHLVHLAWHTAHREYWTSPENMRWIEASIALVRYFRAAGGRRAIIAGTCAEYEWSNRLYVERETPLVPTTLYGTAKDALRRVVEAYARDASFDLAWGRLFFLFGPHEQPQRLVPSVISALLQGDIPPETSGALIRDFLHVRDAGSAFAALADSAVVGPVNIASGVGTKLADVVDAIASYIGRLDLVRRERPLSSTEPPTIVASVARLDNEVGWRPSLTVTEGLRQTVDWWRNPCG
ncbi:MAG: NAD-dependent epimerase/dehydratase family protein [Gaiellaceae bacterium]